MSGISNLLVLGGGGGGGGSAGVELVDGLVNCLDPRGGKGAVSLSAAGIVYVKVAAETTGWKCWTVDLGNTINAIGNTLDVLTLYDNGVDFDSQGGPISAATMLLENLAAGTVVRFDPATRLIFIAQQTASNSPDRGGSGGTMTHVECGTITVLLTSPTANTWHYWERLVGHEGMITEVPRFGRVVKVHPLLTTTAKQTVSGTTQTVVTGLTATFTPQAETQRILVLGNLNLSSSSATYPAGAWITCDLVGSLLGDAAGSRTRVQTATPPSASAMAELSLLSIFNAAVVNASHTISVKVASFNAAASAVVNATGTDSDSANYPRGASTMMIMELSD